MRAKTLRTVEQEQALFRGLRVSEVAERLACSVEHVHDLIRARKLAAINISVGKKPEFRIHIGEFERYVKASAA